MHLWDTQKLADEIVAGQVSANAKVSYFVFSAVFTIVLGYAAGYGSFHGSWLYVYEAAVVGAVTFAGAKKVARSYLRPIDGEFFEMAYLLSVPLLVKTTLASWIAIWGGYWLISALVPQLPVSDSAESSQALAYWVNRIWQVLPFLVGVTIALVYWYRLAHHVAYVAHKRCA